MEIRATADGNSFSIPRRQARFTVWSLAFQREDGGSETRYTTCLPLCFKPEWIALRREGGAHNLDLIGRSEVFRKDPGREWWALQDLNL